MLLTLERMIGQCPTICDILLTEVPEAIDLHCYEQMPPEEQEEEQDARNPYRVTVDCGLCKRTVKFVVLSDSEDIRALQEVLFTVSFLCLECVKTNRLHHGG